MPLAGVVPEFAGLLDARGYAAPDRAITAEIRIGPPSNRRTLLAQVGSCRPRPRATAPRIAGYVVTFDDITELLSAQRKAAWADVARRIAHEIKNPLTPIQLSAERLKRRYLKQITNDPETFIDCTDTIIRQVGDIGRMVDEFSSFARMPQPVISPRIQRALPAGAVPAAQRRIPEIDYRLRAARAGRSRPATAGRWARR